MTLASIFCFQTTWALGVVTLKPKKARAAVYQKPDFDAKIIYLLPKEKKVLGTRSTVEGLNGLGLFHKVKLGQSKYGYMLDTEVQIVGGSKPSKKKRRDKKQSFKKKVSLSDLAKDSKKSKGTDTVAQKKKQSNRNDKYSNQANPQLPRRRSLYPGRFNGPRQNTDNRPLIFSRLIGGSLGLVNYSEDVGSGSKSSNEVMYGLKISGPNLIFKNFLLDISVLLHFGAPSFFDDFSTDASGFFVLTDFTMPFILSRSESRYIYGGLGLMLNASFFDFNFAGRDESSQNIRLGGVGTFGLAYNLGELWALKLEGKYYFEKSSYWGVLAGIQKKF